MSCLVEVVFRWAFTLSERDVIDRITAVLFQNREMNPTEFDHRENKLKCLSFAFRIVGDIKKKKMKVSWIRAGL